MSGPTEVDEVGPTPADPAIGSRWVSPQRRVYTVVAVTDGAKGWSGIRLVHLHGDGLKSVRRESLTYFLNNFQQVLP